MSEVAPLWHEDFWRKAQMFINRSFDGDARSFDERAFWASGSLELLGKAALSRRNPLLVAEASHDGTQLLAAAGLIERPERLGTVAAGAVFDRCKSAFRPFDSNAAKRVAASRNEYIHGTGLGFMNTPEEVWWTRFWPLAVTLIEANDLQIADFVGTGRVSEVESYLERNAEHVRLRVESLVNSARRRWEALSSGVLTETVAASMRKRGGSLSAGLGFSSEFECPVCLNDGEIEGEEAEVDRIERESDEAWYSMTAYLSVGTEYFSCKHCGLVLETWEQAEEGGLPESFEYVDPEWDDIEEEYMDE